MWKAAFLALILVLAYGTAAHAATADFQGICFGYSPTNCAFDANRTSTFGSGTSCAPAFVTGYLWDFGDGSFLYPASSFESHIYPNRDAYLVHLAVYCSDNSSATATQCVNTSAIGANGCIHPDQGWQP